MFPRHLDLPEAHVESASITPREASFVVRFPAVDPLATRSARAVSSAASVLAMQLDDAFSRIIETVRGRPEGPVAGEAPTTESPGTKPPSGEVRDWAEHLGLSPRQREVFALL